MTDHPEELELKFRLTPPELDELAHCEALHRIATGKMRKRRLVSTYYDTPGHALRKAGFTIRVRRTGGRWVQTVKAGAAIVGGVSNPMEIEHRLRGLDPRPDLLPKAKIRKAVLAVIGEEALQPVFTTEIDRRLVDCEFGDTSAELALDHGLLRWPGGEVPISEAELELKDGSVDGLHEIACTLFDGRRFVFGSSSKASLGYRMLGGMEEPLRPFNARPADVAKNDTVAAAFVAMMRSAVEQVLANWSGFLEGDDPEFAHQMRIGLRRLRVCLGLFGGLLDIRGMDDLKRGLRDLGRIVGDVRDADVLLADLVAPVDLQGHAVPEAEALEQFLHKLASDRRKSARGVLDTPDWNRLRLQLALLPLGAGWSAGARAKAEIGTRAGDMLARAWKKVCKRAHHIDELDTLARHDLRKKLKTMRYSFEFLSFCYKKKQAKAFVKRLRVLQDTFGGLNDAALAGTLPRLCAAAPDRVSAKVESAAWFVAGWHSAIAERDWHPVRERWKALKGEALPWE